MTRTDREIAKNVHLKLLANPLGFASGAERIDIIEAAFAHVRKDAGVKWLPASSNPPADRQQCWITAGEMVGLSNIIGTLAYSAEHEMFWDLIDAECYDLKEREIFWLPAEALKIPQPPEGEK